MSRYIDKEILKNKILNDMAKAEWEGKDLNGYTDALFHLKTIPTADVVEVRHGEWEYIEEDECYICSNCKASALNNYRGLSVNSNYCHDCGAKMDGERKEE